MVRTRANCSGVRVGTKASFKTTPHPTATTSSGRRRSGPGNRYCPRETPAWQKQITHFLNTNSDGHSSGSYVEETVPDTQTEKDT